MRSFYLYYQAFYPIVYTIIIEIIMFFLDFYPLDFIFSWINIFSILFICSPLVIPAVILIFNYREEDNKVKNISNDGEYVISSSNEKSCILKITKVFRDSKKDFGLEILPWTDYFYYIIETENNTFHVSCFHKNVERIVSFDEILNKNYPFIKVNTEENKKLKN